MAGLLITPLLALVQTTPAGAAEDEWIDTYDRAAVLAAYEAEFDRTEPASGWTGDTGACQAGTTTQEYRDSVVQRVNWYRSMAGLSPVTEHAAYSAATQQTSMMMSAQGMLNHHPGNDWACHTTTGATTAADSNLALGVNGIDAIDAYIRDPGENNLKVGHRRTILYPQLLEVGSGDVESGDGHWAANTLHVFDDNIWGERPDVREDRGFVAWPPSGYVPPGVVWGRWSFSLDGADFGDATVTVTDSLGAIGVHVIARIQPSDPTSRIAPEPSIVWTVGGDSNSNLLPAPDNGDECYTITIDGVRVNGVGQAEYAYRTCVIDPDFIPSPTSPVQTPNMPKTPDPTTDPGTPVACDTAEFGAWSLPCWTGQPTLGPITDIVADWQRQPVAWLVANEITTGVSPTRFDPDSSLTRAQAATFIWRLVGSPEPTADAPTFSDVPAGSYYEDAVRWMAHVGVTQGTGGNRFSPNAAATRAEFVTFLWRLVEKPIVDAPMPFTDLTASWQVDSVRWAATSDVTTGITASSFAPDASVTRGQAAALLYRFADILA